MTLVAFMAISGTAQTAKGKTGLVNTFAFGGKDGITKYINAAKSIETEFKKDYADLQALGKSIQTKQAELQNLQKQASQPNSPIKQSTLVTKAGEIDKLRREGKFKQDDLTARVNARRQVVITPIWNDLRKAMNEFAKKNGFAVILDGAKLEEEGILLGFDTVYDVTKQFITFYNARPAGTATK